MPDTLPPLDLDAIEAAIAECRTYNFGMYQADRLAHGHAPALVEEVKRLRAELDQAAPHITYARGHLDSYRHAGSALLDAEAKVERQRDRLRAREEQVRRLRAEVTRLHALVADLRATTAPAWDEDAVVEDMARAVYPLLFEDDRQPLRVFGEARSDAELREGERDVARVRMRQALAVVREHLPVKPDRDAVARAIFEAGAAGAAVEFGLDGPVPWSSLDVDDVERMCAQADAVLDLWPGRSEAEVKAEALNEAADSLERLDGENLLRGLIARIRARADRLAAEGGDDRG